MKRLELTHVRVCRRCGRGRAELVSSAGEVAAVPLDPARARALRSSAADLRPLADLVLAQLAAAGSEVRDVVLDVEDGVMRGLLSIARGAETDVVVCTPQEAVELVARGGLALYATDDAIAYPAGRETAPPTETLH